MAIVRVNLPCGPPFLATLCPKAIHYDNVQKGVSHKKYLEIDNCFAKELRIFEQGMQVRSETCEEWAVLLVKSDSLSLFCQSLVGRFSLRQWWKWRCVQDW